jgi:hypothetical protein
MIFCHVEAADASALAETHSSPFQCETTNGFLERVGNPGRHRKIPPPRPLGVRRNSRRHGQIAGKPEKTGPCSLPGYASAGGHHAAGLGSIYVCGSSWSSLCFGSLHARIPRGLSGPAHGSSVDLYILRGRLSLSIRATSTPSTRPASNRRRATASMASRLSSRRARHESAASRNS